MSKDSNKRLFIWPFITGIVLGIIAKFADGSLLPSIKIQKMQSKP